jgi:predicted acyl esterase
MAPRVGFSNLYHNWVYTGGAFQLGFNLRWGAVQMHTRTNRLQHLWMPPEQHYSTLFWHLPLRTGDERAGRVNEFYREWIRHPDYGPYWERLGNVEKDYAEIDVPAYGFGGWYDVFLQGTLNNFMGVRAKGPTERARRQKVLIGPWIHSLGEPGTQSRTGDVDFERRA